ncbi:heavy metal transporter [Halobacteriales archaeon QS_1_68_20]|nr:MAG: heavy metal transporter [Halobacteriales archaeon QS_1_68_20]
MATYELPVPSMSCGGCQETVENAVTDVAGVEQVTADHESGTVEVTGDASTDAVSDAIERSGYDVKA